MALLFILVSSFALFAHGMDNMVYEAKAYFSRYAMGEVTIINGNVMIDLDITNVSKYVGMSGTGIPDDCLKNGAYVHVHTNWNQDTEMDYMGEDDCDTDQTGDHYDPWFACSRKSEQDDCNFNGGCIRPSSFISNEPGVEYRCSASDYEMYPYACEVGDMGKHEAMVGVSGSKRIKETYSSLWEMSAMDFEDDFSVVFHCSNEDKTPFLCAPFNKTMRMKMNSDPMHIQNANNKVSVKFDGLSAYGRSYNGMEIQQGEGWIRYKMPKAASDNCTQYSAYIMDRWNTSMMMSDEWMPRYDDMCDEMYIGKVYDPTYSCINEDAGFMESANDRCENGQRCPNNDNNGATDVDYECDNMENAMKCAAGHMTGRSGYINLTMHMGKTYDMTFDDRVSPPLRDLVGRSVLLVCEDDDAMPKKMCAPITSESLSFTLTEEEIGWTAGGVLGVLVLICLIFGIGSAYCYGKKNGNNANGNVTLDHKFSALGGRSPTSDSTRAAPSFVQAKSTSYASQPVQTNDEIAPASPIVDDEEEEMKETFTMNEGGGYLEEPEEEEIGALPMSPAPEPEARQYAVVTAGGPMNSEMNHEQQYYDE